jgi:hypothetical protein
MSISRGKKLVLMSKLQVEQSESSSYVDRWFAQVNCNTAVIDVVIIKLDIF